MCLWREEGKAPCHAPGASEDARHVADLLGIPHTTVDCSDAFRTAVVDRFASEYAGGRTPSPCIWCNAAIKFGRLLEEALARGADALATGHYARVFSESGRRILARGRSLEKDQSYFLHRLDQRQLGRALFPLGDMSKADVRAVVRKLGLPVHDREESQEICFVRSEGYAGFLQRHYGLAGSPGPIIGPDGTTLGRHAGIHHYTLGQRRGLGVSGPRPYYVTGIDPVENSVRVGFKEDTYRRAFVVRDVIWAAGEPAGGEYLVQIRSRHAAAPSMVSPLEVGNARVQFEKPQSSITPGQAAVFYRGDGVEGGGWIEEVM